MSTVFQENCFISLRNRRVVVSFRPTEEHFQDFVKIRFYYSVIMAVASNRTDLDTSYEGNQPTFIFNSYRYTSSSGDLLYQTAQTMSRFSAVADKVELPITYFSDLLNETCNCMHRSSGGCQTTTLQQSPRCKSRLFAFCAQSFFGCGETSLNVTVEAMRMHVAPVVLLLAFFFHD